MKTRAWTIAAALCLSASFAGCKKSSDSGGGGTIHTVSITVSKKAVVANGSNSVTLTVTDNTGAAVTVTTSRGTFGGGGTSATVNGTGTVTLITCNAQLDASCAGVATVTGLSGTTTGQATITFGTLASACLSDCAADPACPSHACVPAGGGTGTCSSTTPSVCTAGASCTPTQTTETTCNDGIDNDCNGDIDCADTACDNQQCKAGSPTFLCKAGVCTDTLSGLGIDVTPARTRMPANGTATTTVAVTVTSGGQPAGGMGVTVSTTAGSFGGVTTGTTGTDGIATFTFTAPAAPGVATITAQLTGVATISKTAVIAFPAIGALQIPPTPVEFPVQGAKGSGFQEFGFLAVLVKDDTGQPYPDGLDVRFEHRPLGGSTLGAPLVACVPADPGCVAFQAATSSGGNPPDSVGIATGFLYSGSIAGTLVTTASATVAGVTRTVTLPTVAVVGAKANAANFSIVCSPRNVPALAETDCAISLVDAPFTCEALLKDRYGNVLGTATQVIFMSEAAAVGKVTTTPAYDPVKDPPPDLGIAAQIFNTLGAGLPFDVPPAVGEPSSSHGFDGCGVRVHNPRDGLLTIIAIADGEEAFFDSNGNGVYDLGEPFIDQGEPFVDENDNGQWDSGEWFLDVNGNGIHDGPNGVWDGATKIWTQTVVLYTGAPATVPSGLNLLGTRWTENTAAGACTPTPAPANFSVFSVKPGPPPVPATSQTYLVFASDMNLNLLDTGTKYDTSVVVGTIKADYLGLKSVADDLGLFYRFWPCDQTGFCASQCRSTGGALPCVMTPSISDFGCGFGGSVLITGGASPDPGLDVVDWNVSTPYDVFGGSKTALGVRALAGTNN